MFEIKKRSWKAQRDHYNSPPLSWVIRKGFRQRRFVSAGLKKAAKKWLTKRLGSVEYASLLRKKQRSLTILSSQANCVGTCRSKQTEIFVLQLLNECSARFHYEAKQKRVIHWVDWTTFNWRVWSWLRLNAGGRPNTCKSSGNREKLASLLTSGGRVSNTWEFAFRRGTTTGNCG